MARPDIRWMPINWADYWRDTGHLSALEHGAYLNLIGAYWTAGGPLVNNVTWLQRLSKCTQKEWLKIGPVVLAFFQEVDGKLTHKRVDEELANSKQRYERRASAGKAGGVAKAKQNPSNATALPEQCHTHTTIVHSPIGETSAKADVGAARPQSKRASGLPEDWTISLKDRQHAASQGLDPQTIANIENHFRDDCRAKGRTSKDWSASWRTWIAKHIGWYGTGPWPRPDASRPKTHAGNRASVYAARDQILAEAGVQPHGNADPLRAEGGTRATGNNHGAEDFGEVIDADFRERSAGPFDGTEGPDEAPGGTNNTGRCRAVEGLPEEGYALPSGRSAPCADNPTRRQPMVAGVAGVTGSAGGPHLPAEDDVQGPEFKRTA